MLNFAHYQTKSYSTELGVKKVNENDIREAGVVSWTCKEK